MTCLAFERLLNRKFNSNAPTPLFVALSNLPTSIPLKNDPVDTTPQGE